MKLRDIYPAIISEDDYDFNLAMKLLMDDGHELHNILRRLRYYSYLEGIPSYTYEVDVIGEVSFIKRTKYDPWQLGTLRNMPLFISDPTKTLKLAPINTTGNNNVALGNNAFRYEVPISRNN